MHLRKTSIKITLSATLLMEFFRSQVTIMNKKKKTHNNVTIIITIANTKTFTITT